MPSYTVTAMKGGHDRTFSSLEDARSYAGELTGENDSLDIHITDDKGRRHLTAEQREFVDEATDITKVQPETTATQGDMERLARNRRQGVDAITQALSDILNDHDLAGIAFLVPEADGGNRGMMIVNAKRISTVQFLAQNIDYSQQVLSRLLQQQPSKPQADE